jgi:glycine cleavage system H protein
VDIPKDRKYTKTHEWVKIDGDTAIVGVSEYAQKELSDVVYIELPEVGRLVTAGEALCVVESVKAAFDIYSPLTGSVVEVNSSLDDDPSLVNKECYTNGWFFKITPDKTDEISELMDSSQYVDHVDSIAH